MLKCTRTGAVLPVIYDVDVIVVGGASPGVAAAREATRQGAAVFLVAAEPYLGEDICGTYNFWNNTNKLEGELANLIYNRESVPAPAEVKRLLNNQLIDHEVPFLFSSYVSNVLFDEQDNIAGIIIANRSGEQVVRGKVIVDATSSASVSRMAGAAFRKFKAGKYEVQYTVLGNKPKEEITHEVFSPGFVRDGKTYEAVRYTLEMDFPDSKYQTLQEIEQKLKDITWDRDQVDSADYFRWNRPDYLIGKRSLTGIRVDDFDIGAFIPGNVERLYLVNGCADVDRDVMHDFNVPSNMMAVAEKIGRQAGKVALEVNMGAVKKGTKSDGADIRLSYHIDEMRENHFIDTYHIGEEELSLLGEYEVLIIGGGTAGACAAIGAAREGGKTLVVENLHGLGGTGTMGYIAKYWDGYREGFTKEIDLGVDELGGDSPRKYKRMSSWVVEWKKEWYRRQVRKAGGEIWFGLVSCGAVVEEDDIQGVVVVTPDGKGVVKAKRVIDATGSADVAIAAGADYKYTNEETVAVQGAGVPPVIPGKDYINTDWRFISDSDVFDITATFVASTEKFKNEFDIGKLLQTRERRRVVGDYEVSVLDVFNGRTYPDTFSYHISSFDTHGFIIDPFFMIRPPEKRHKIENAWLPLRAMLPRGLNHILVTGLGVSAHRDALPVLRMQPCVQNQGYAAGLLAVMSIRDNKNFRAFDIRKIQKRLVAIDNLPEETLTHQDNYPPTIEKISKSVDSVVDAYKGLETILWDAKNALPIVKERIKKTEDKHAKLTYAFILGIYFIDDGWKELLEAVEEQTDWDEGWNYTGMGQFGESMSYLDRLIIALGRTKRKEVLEAITEKANRLTITSAFSHFRAVALALEQIGGKEAAATLAEILELPGIKGHAVLSLREAAFAVKPDRNDTSIRNDCLKELFVARALYNCGDYEKIGEAILKEYANDLRGHYALHARSILREYQA